MVVDAHEATEGEPHRHERRGEEGSDDGIPLRAHRRDHIATDSSREIPVPSARRDDSYEWAYSHGYRPSWWARYLCQGAGRRGACVVRSTRVVWTRGSS
jgi:hypothetical protein